MLKVPAGEFIDTLQTMACSPLEPGVIETNYNAHGIGLIIDGTAELISF